MREPGDTQPAGGDCPHLGQSYNPLEEPQLDNPYPFYARARSEEPVFFSERLQAWVVTRYDDVRSILLRPDIFSSKDTFRPIVTWVPEVFQVLARSDAATVPIFINTDGREHMRFRTPLNQAFVPARLKAMESTIRPVAHRLVDTFYKEGHTDLVANFAGPLPQEIILRLFGIPQADMAQCKRWSEDYLALIASPLSPQRQVECAHSFVAFNEYMAALAEKRSANLGEDVVSCLLTVHYDEAQPLTRAEVVATLSTVLLAGHEATTNVIGTAVYLLLSQPERWQHVCEHPEDIPAAVEEILRFDTTHGFFRTALQEAQVGGVTIPAGGRIFPAYASADHDEARFANAEQFDLQRSPNQHLAFGHGVHFCVGAPLARIELRIAVEVLSQRLPQLRLQPHQHISYHPMLLGRSLRQLGVAWSVAQEEHAP